MAHVTYIEARAGRPYIRASRVPLESIIVVWLQGHSPEEIRENFPTLNLAEVYGAIAYYLDHQTELDQQMMASQAEYEAKRAAAEAVDPERYATLCRRLAEARAHHTESLHSSAS